jgi:GNAT superfamily N-acetyltransferase
MTVRAGELEDRAEYGGGIHIVRIAHDHLDPERLGARFDHVDVLRMTVFVDEEAHGLGLGDALCHGHRFGAGGGLIQQRGVRDFQTGEIGHHGLEVQQRLQPPLGYFGLIGRVGRIPRGVLEDIALDRGGRDGPVIPLPDERGEHLVLACHDFHVPQ